MEIKNGPKLINHEYYGLIKAIIPVTLLIDIFESRINFIAENGCRMLTPSGQRTLFTTRCKVKSTLESDESQG